MRLRTGRGTASRPQDLGVGFAGGANSTDAVEERRDSYSSSPSSSPHLGCHLELPTCLSFSLMETRAEA